MPGERYEMDHGLAQVASEPHGKELIIAARPLEADDEGWELVLGTGLWGELVMNQISMEPEFVVPFATWQDALACFESVVSQLQDESRGDHAVSE